MMENSITPAEHALAENSLGALRYGQVGTIPAEFNGQRVLVMTVDTTDGTGVIPVAIVIDRRLIQDLVPAGAEGSETVLSDDVDQACA